MPTYPITVEIDFAETRVRRGRLGLLASGLQGGREGWDTGLNSDTLVWNITHTATLYPYPARAEWGSTFSGSYARLRKANYDVAGSESWAEHHLRGSGDVYLYGLGTNAAVATTEIFARNRGFLISWFAFGQNDTFAQLRVILGGNVGVEFYSDGAFVVYKPCTSFAGFTAANEVGRGSLTETQGYERGSSRPDSVTGKAMDVILMPWRGRELLVASNRGGGESVVFEDIPIEGGSGEITPAGPLRWQVPAGQVMVQAAPLRFPSSGVLVSYPTEFALPPESGEEAAETLVHYHAPGYGTPGEPVCTVVADDGATAFVGDGSQTTARLRVALSGDGTNTPFVYGASAEFAALTAETDDSEAADITAYVTGLSLSVPDGAEGVSLRLTLTNREQGGDSAEEFVPQLARMANRPVRLRRNGVTLWQGRTGNPRIIEAATDDAVTFEIECEDWGKVQRRTQVKYPTPDDARNLADAIARYVAHTHPDAPTDIEPYGLPVPTQGRASEGEWDRLPEPGATPADLLRGLTDDYAANAVYGWVPRAAGMTYLHKPPDSLLTTTRRKTVYLTHAAAKAALVSGGMSAADAEKEAVYHVLTGWEEETIEAEANDTRVTGWDSRLGKAFQVYTERVDMKEVTTVPSSRPSEWHGEEVPVEFFYPEVATLEAAEYVAAVLEQRLFSQPRVAEASGQAQYHTDGTLIWRGDQLNTPFGLYRVLAGPDMEAVKETASGGDHLVWEPTRYIVERVGEAA